MADEPSQTVTGPEDAAIEPPPDLEEPALAGSDRLLAWSSMDLPGMDSSEGSE